MPHYYFDIHDGERWTDDDEGLEFESLKAVRDAATAVLPAIARDELRDSDRQTFTVKVRDENGRCIFRASLSLVAEWLAGRPEDHPAGDEPPPASCSSWSA